MRLYLAGPLFCQAEREFNERLASELRAEGHEVFLPQEFVPTDGVYDEAFLLEAYARDLEEIDAADAFVIVLDGRVPDEGACVELGYALARGKDLFGLKTDVRVSERGGDNAMIRGALRGRVHGDIPSLIDALSQ
ncbi:MAG: DUF4406 domain-containing protein [Thermoplasmatales archaeon]|nr:DUF4406 domain-containing protein [Thermoplasmatales archaeon]